VTIWQKRFGWIVPSWNSVTEFEVERLAGDGVSNHFTRIAHTEDSEAAFERMGNEAPAAAGLLADAKVDAISYACTAGSFSKGFAYDEDLARRISDETGTPVTTMAGSLIAAARHLGFETVAVAAPYERWLMDRLVVFLEAGGLRVLKSEGLGHQANVLYEPEKALELADRAWDPAADGLIMSCGNFRTLEMIDTIEARLGRPVVTSVQASYWAMLQATGHPVATTGAGVLLRDGTASAIAAG
jgi:maleate isomerase